MMNNTADLTKGLLIGGALGMGAGVLTAMYLHGRTQRYDAPQIPSISQIRDYAGDNAGQVIHMAKAMHSVNPIDTTVKLIRVIKERYDAIPLPDGWDKVWDTHIWPKIKKLAEGGEYTLGLLPDIIQDKLDRIGNLGARGFKVLKQVIGDYIGKTITVMALFMVNDYDVKKTVNMVSGLNFAAEDLPKIGYDWKNVDYGKLIFSGILIADDFISYAIAGGGAAAGAATGGVAGGSVGAAGAGVGAAPGAAAGGTGGAATGAAAAGTGAVTVAWADNIIAGFNILDAISDGVYAEG